MDFKLSKTHLLQQEMCRGDSQEHEVKPIGRRNGRNRSVRPGASCKDA